MLNILNRETTELYLLTRREIYKSGSVCLADFSDGAKLFGIAKTAGHTETHHKCAGGLFPVKDPYPLESVAFVRGNGFPTVPNVVRNVVDHLKPVFLPLQNLRGVYFRFPAFRSRCRC